MIMKSIILLFWVFTAGVSAEVRNSTNDISFPNGVTNAPLTEPSTEALSYSRFKGTNYVARLRDMDVKDSPMWTAEEKPPLPAKKAVALARRYLNAYFGLPEKVEGREIDTWDFRLVSLHRIIGSDVWYYKVAFQPYYYQSFNNSLVTVFVTMSGNVSSLERTSYWREEW